MAWKRPSAFLTDERGAVAATYALALIGLVMIGGVAWDFSRMAMMDSELQNAADQAALAAATQLDGSPDSINRAVARASDLVKNQTYMANDGGNSGVTVNSVTFFKTRDNAEAGESGFTDNARSAEAHFVRVIVNAREAFYAFTPIVGAVSSGNMDARATAGMGSAICREPPLFVCKPTGSIGDPVTWIENQRGKGILLKAKGTAWMPGNFGFLETNAGSGANDIGKLLAYGNPPGDCVSVDAPETAPGQKQSVVPDFNTRFDIYENGDPIDCYSSNSLCPPAANSRKDIVQPKTAAPTSKNDCTSPAGGWVFSNRPYRPTTAANLSGSTAADFPDAMGLPRDLCHALPEASQNCSGGFVGTGDWDINAYWWANYGEAYPGTISTAITGRTYPTRFEVYEWEKTNAPAYRDIPGTTMRNYKAPICRSGPTSGTPDRRIVPIAVVDCSTLDESKGAGGGKQTVYPVEWMDVFLVEPSLDRKVGSTIYTSKGDFYGEVIGRTHQGTGGAGAQVVRRDKPYLVK